MRPRSLGFSLRLTLLAFVALLVAAAPHLAFAQDATGPTLKIRWYEDMVNLDPVLLQDSLGNEVAYKIYDTLVAVKPGTFDTIVPELAESWEVADDGLTYTFHLKHGVMWQHGYGEVTADDVRFSFLRHKDEALASVYKTSADPIKDVVAVDPYTVRVVMSQPYPTFLQDFVSYRPGFIVNKKALEDLGDRYMDQPVGSGPFMLQSWTPLDRVVLVRNPDYSGPKPYFAKLEYVIIPDDNVFEIALQNGEVDIGWIFDPQVQQRAVQSTTYSALSMPAPRTIYIQDNITKPGLDDVRVRQALWYAIDRQLLVDTILLGQGKVSDTVLNPSVFGYLDAQLYDYDPDKARALLKEAGHANDLSFELLIQGNYQIPAMAQAIQAMWADVGVSVNITQREFPQIVEARRAGNFDLVMGALARSGADQYVSYFYDSAAIPYPNSSQYSNAKVDDLVHQGRVTVDDAKRKAVYEQIQRITAQDAPVIPILSPVFVLAFRSDLQGVKLALLTINAADLSLAP